MKKVAITGNIGSGKSWVCELFKQRLNIPVYNSDDAAKQMYFHPEVREKLVNRFGDAIYLSDTEIDRRYLADLIFHDETAQRDLEGILYPALFVDFESWMTKQNAPYVLFESALVFEKRLEKRFDAVVMVSASEATRLRRAMARDHCDEATVRTRMAKQWPEEGKRLLADYVIWHECDDEDDALLKQIKEMHKFCGLNPQ
ncbi:MAG: dephospho-CoA kinase [Bacteroidales bacterium]|nr:dephospho-CoA kinase [Bacteroidales bacterium]